MHRISIILISLLLFFSCSENKLDERLVHINEIISESPIEALSYLDSINYEELSYTDQYLYDFLTIKAKDKAYIKHTSDSLILKIIEYDANHQTNGRYSETLYYGGRVYSDLGDYPKALKYFQESLSTMSKSKNLRLKGAVLSQIGRLFNSIRLYDRAIPYLTETIRIDSLLKDSINLMYDRQLLGIVYLHTKKYNEAEKSLELSKNLSVHLFPQNLQQQALQNMYLAALKYYTGDIDSALILIRNVPKNIHPISLNTALAYSAEIYSKAGIIDSTYYFANRLINTPDSLNHKTGYHILLSDQMKPYIHKDSLVNYIYRYRQALEQYLNKNDIQNTAIQNSFFNYQLIEAENNKLTNITQITKRWLMIALIIILVLILCILFYKYRHKTQLLKLYDALDNINLLKQQLDKQRNLTITKVEDTSQDDITQITTSSISVITPSTTDLREKLREELLTLYQTNKDYKIPPVIIQSEAYKILHQHIAKNKPIKECSNLWVLIEHVILEYSPDFKTNLLLLTNGKLSLEDLRMAYLIKFGVSPSQMISLLGRTKGTISSRRQSICFKVFDKKLGTRIIDSIIRSL